MKHKVEIVTVAEDQEFHIWPGEQVLNASVRRINAGPDVPLAYDVVDLVVMKVV